jgi:hypothetical protein
MPNLEREIMGSLLKTRYREIPNSDTDEFSILLKKLDKVNTPRKES